MRIEIPDHVKTAFDVLERNGHEAYIVGGCVRDALLGKTPGDYDMTTSALPEETVAAFGGFHVIETGLKHGTVTVVIDGFPVEITTFRTDGEYFDKRHPENVTFTRSLETDLERRDFTVNAMAYSEKRGLVDLFGGRDDLKNKVIRAVGEPEKRFSEDALRILRALRFSSVYGFEIEEETAKAALKLKDGIDFLSAERVFSELKKLLVGDHCEEVLLEYPEIVCRILPELSRSVGFSQNNPHHIYDVYTHTVKCVSACPKDYRIRLAALLHDSGKPETYSEKDGVGHFYGHSEASLRLAKAALCRLKADNATKETVLTLIKYHDPVIEINEKSVRRMMNKITPKMLFKLLDLKSADNLAQSPECRTRLEGYAEIRKIADKLLSEDACFSLRQLKVNGDDLLSLGFEKGKALGDVLSKLLSDVISGKLPNEKEVLLKEAVKYLRK